jgi:hypothetical protein
MLVTQAQFAGNTPNTRDLRFAKQLGNRPIDLFPTFSTRAAPSPDMTIVVVRARRTWLANL